MKFFSKKKGLICVLMVGVLFVSAAVYFVAHSRSPEQLGVYLPTPRFEIAQDREALSTAQRATFRLTINNEADYDPDTEFEIVWTLDGVDDLTNDTNEYLLESDVDVTHNLSVRVRAVLDVDGRVLSSGWATDTVEVEFVNIADPDISLEVEIEDRF